MEKYVRIEKFKPERLQDKGQGFVILCEWILKLQELAFNQLRGNQIKSRKGDIESDQNIILNKLDSKSINYYNRNVASYRWPKNYALAQ